MEETETDIQKNKLGPLLIPYSNQNETKIPRNTGLTPCDIDLRNHFFKEEAIYATHTKGQRTLRKRT